jgi:hypothetical protein
MSCLAVLLAINESLFRHGVGAAVAGFVIAGLFFFITRRGVAGARRGGASDFVAGRYLGLIVLRWVFLVGGVIGLGLMLAAVV